MKLHTAIFTGLSLALYRTDEENRALPTLNITRGGLDAGGQAQWDVLLAAIGGFLQAGETLRDIHLAPSVPVAIDWTETIVETLDGPRSQQQASAWRVVLEAAFTIACADGGTRQVNLATEQFTSAEARDALLAFWAALEALP